MSLWVYDNRWKEVPARNAAKGLTAFIVCAGASLNSIPVATLRGVGRTVIAVNSAYPTVLPDYWIGMDDPCNHEASLFSESFPKIVNGGKPEADCYGVPLRDMPNVWFADTHRPDRWDEKGFKWEGHSLSAAIQFAFHIGCVEIVLVGVDLDNSSTHYHDGNYLTPEQAARNQTLYDQQLDYLRTVRDELLQRGIALESATRGSRINAFLPYRSIQERILELESCVKRGRGQLHCLTQNDACIPPLGH
jgi:hypothetical protein